MDIINLAEVLGVNTTCSKEEIKPFDTSKLFKEYRGLSVLNKKYCCTENRNVTERFPLSEGEFINNWRIK